MLAEATAQIIKELAEPGSYRKYGTYHVAATGETSWHGYAQVVVEKANKLGIPTKLSAKEIKPIATKDYPMPAVRPANSRLDTTKVRTVFSVRLPKWQDEVEKVLKELIEAKT
jgi:dTDP-4-dehydrorhamnose reductase